MCQVNLMIFFIIGANCDCISPQTSAFNTDKLQTSVDQLSTPVTEDDKNLDEINEEHIKTNSIFNTLQQKLDANQKSLYPFKDENLVDDCSDLYDSGLHVSTSYFLQKYNRQVNCDMETEGGGWLLIQKRRKLINQIDFNRDWASYKQGFGDLDTEFWIGNEFLHRITNQKSYELRIDMEDFELGPFYATYSEFRVGNEESGYKLHIGGYEGTVMDSLYTNNNTRFSTFDRDNDNNWNIHCAKLFSGAFWYDSCDDAHLNGMFPTVPDRNNKQFINWYHKGEYLILINVAMKIRPKNCRLFLQ